MKYRYVFYFLVFISCKYPQRDISIDISLDTLRTLIPGKLIIELKKVNNDSVIITSKVQIINTDTIPAVSPDLIIAYAKSLIGIPYKYGSINPAAGLDCSGFITYVFNHFGIEVPRSSVDFTNYGETINQVYAQPGDLILFTGTDITSTEVGHMGIITGNILGVINFIHSTSGKAMGVTITTLNKYYRKRFVKIIRIPFYPVQQY